MDDTSANELGPEADAKSRPPENVIVSQDPRESIAQATSSVPIEAFSKSGIKSIRVLSESKFLDVLKGLVESSLERRLEEWKMRLSRSREAEGQRLKAGQRESLRRIEGRMAKLSRAFVDIEDAFGRLEKPGNEPMGNSPPLTGRPQGSEKKQRALLREMLLKKGD